MASHWRSPLPTMPATPCNAAAPMRKVPLRRVCRRARWRRRPRNRPRRRNRALVRSHRLPAKARRRPRWRRLPRNRPRWRGQAPVRSCRLPAKARRRPQWLRLPRNRPRWRGLLRSPARRRSPALARRRHLPKRARQRPRRRGLLRNRSRRRGGVPARRRRLGPGRRPQRLAQPRAPRSVRPVRGRIPPARGSRRRGLQAGGGNRVSRSQLTGSGAHPLKRLAGGGGRPASGLRRPALRAVPVRRMRARTRPLATIGWGARASLCRVAPRTLQRMLRMRNGLPGSLAR